MRFLGSRPSISSVAVLFAVVGAISHGAMAQTSGAVPIGSGGAAAPAGGVPAPIVMIVDDQRVVGQSKAFKSIQGQIEGQRQNAQKEFASKQNDLEAAAADLQRDQRSGALNADQLEEKRHALVKRQEEIQKDADGRRQALQNTYSDALDKVKGALLEVVQGLAQERHANLVLIRSDVILFDKSYDASADALTRLDNKIQSVTVAPASTASASSSASSSTTTSGSKKK